VGLWLSYLFVLFYLAVAAGAVTHVDLFLENPVKRSFLSVEHPLLASFFLADRESGDARRGAGVPHGAVIVRDLSGTFFGADGDGNNPCRSPRWTRTQRFRAWACRGNRQLARSATARSVLPSSRMPHMKAISSSLAC